MESIKIFRHGKQTFCEWYYDNGKPRGRLLNLGEGVYLENEFSSLNEAKRFCEKQLAKNASLILYVMQGDDIIDTIQNDTYQTAQAKRIDRLFAVVSLALVLLIAIIVSILVMPFKTVSHHVMFIGGIGLFYVLMFLMAGSWHLESVAATLLLLVLLAALIPLLI